MSPARTLKFYKPYGILCAFTDPQDRPNLANYIQIPGVYSAGRLDLDSEGLLILTTDGELIHHLTDPKHHLPKTYLVQVEGVPTVEALAALERGVVIQGYQTGHCQVIIVPEPDLPPRSVPITPHGPTTWLRLVLHEGKKRQIRHMTAAVSLPTLRLVRIAIGSLTLAGLEPGDWRDISPAELKALKEN